MNSRIRFLIHAIQGRYQVPLEFNPNEYAVLAKQMDVPSWNPIHNETGIFRIEEEADVFLISVGPGPMSKRVAKLARIEPTLEFRANVSIKIHGIVVGLFLAGVFAISLNGALHAEFPFSFLDLFNIGLFPAVYVWFVIDVKNKPKEFVREFQAVRDFLNKQNGEKGNF